MIATASGVVPTVMATPVVFGRQGEVLVGTPLTLVRSTGEAVGLDAPVLGARLVSDRVDHGPEAMVKVQVEV